MPTATITTAVAATIAATAVVTTITVVAVTTSVVAALGYYDNGPGRVIRTRVAIVRTRRRVIAIVRAAKRGHAAAKGEQTQKKGKNEGFSFHIIEDKPQLDNY